MASAPRAGSTASTLWPARSRAISAGTCSAESPRLPAGSPRGRDAATAPPAGALVGAAKGGLVRLDHAAQGLARRRRRAQEAVPPAEARRQVHAAVGGRLRQAHAGRERLAVAQPARLLAQPRQRGAGQGVERLAAGPAAGGPPPAGVTPPLQPRRGAVRAARGGGERSLDQPHRLGLARDRRQGPPERGPLLAAEPLDQPQQHLEIGLAHRPPRRHHSTGSLPSNSQREKSLPECRPRRLARLRVPGAHRQAGGAEPARHLADRAPVRPDAEAGLDQRPQLDPAPARHGACPRAAEGRPGGPAPGPARAPRRLPARPPAAAPGGAGRRGRRAPPRRAGAPSRAGSAGPCRPPAPPPPASRPPAPAPGRASAAPPARPGTGPPRAAARPRPAPSARPPPSRPPPPIGHTADRRPRAARGATGLTVRSRGRGYYRSFIPSPWAGQASSGGSSSQRSNTASAPSSRGGTVV